MRVTSRRLALTTASLALTFAVAACGDEGNTSSAAGGSSPSKAPSTTAAAPATPQKAVVSASFTDEQKQEAVDLGAKAAEDAGTPVALPKKTVGVINILSAIESVQRTEFTLRAALKKIGWSVKVCDAQGDPTKMARCGDTLLNQGVDVLFSVGLEPSLIGPQLQAAKKKGVPVINLGGPVTPSPLLSGDYTPDESALGTLLSDYVVEKTKDVSGDKKAFVEDYPAVWASTRTKLFATAAKQNGIDVIKTHVTDATQLQQDTQKSVTDALTANPDLKVLWFSFDAAGQAAAAPIAAKSQGKQFPDGPLVVTFHADSATMDLMRRGQIDAVAEVDYPAGAWVGVDQALEFFARKQPFSKENQPKYPIEYQTQKIVTKDDLPPKGAYVAPAGDYIDFFSTKWSKEFK